MATTTKPRLKNFIRWMIRRDFPEVFEIEQLCFPTYPWQADDFIGVLRQRNCIGMVVEGPQPVRESSFAPTPEVLLVGFFFYELHRDRLEVLNIAVHPSCWRLGVGAAIVDKLKSKLTPQRRSVLRLHVRESNVEAQKFFRSQGFLCVGVLRGDYLRIDEDAYVFEFRCEREASSEKASVAK